jgi:murein DD-endopeptidase MepM/ murein hydrolase activator NlpD
MRVVFFALIWVYLSSCGVQHHLATQLEYDTDSSYVYSLPYPKGMSHFLIQGYNSQLSHRGRLALDFKMNTGSVITAARGGVVVRVEEGFTKGGVSKKYYGKANQVVIRHNDGSHAYYGHLQYNGALVNMGDAVKQGDTIAKAGSTGYSATPHLHFIVWGPTPKGRSQMPTRFKTKRGVEYLKPGRWYRAF